MSELGVGGALIGCGNTLDVVFDLHTWDHVFETFANGGFSTQITDITDEEDLEE